jgi:hypothetical protein
VINDFNSVIDRVYKKYYIHEADNEANKKQSQEQEFQDEPEEPVRIIDHHKVDHVPIKDEHDYEMCNDNLNDNYGNHAGWKYKNG